MVVLSSRVAGIFNGFPINIQEISDQNDGRSLDDLYGIEGDVFRILGMLACENRLVARGRRTQIYELLCSEKNRIRIFITSWFNYETLTLYFLNLSILLKSNLDCHKKPFKSLKSLTSFKDKDTKDEGTIATINDNHLFDKKESEINIHHDTAIFEADRDIINRG